MIIANAPDSSLEFEARDILSCSSCSLIFSCKATLLEATTEGTQNERMRHLAERFQLGIFLQQQIVICLQLH
jgi:hypothetical protein